MLGYDRALAVVAAVDEPGHRRPPADPCPSIWRAVTTFLVGAARFADWTFHVCVVGWVTDMCPRCQCVRMFELHERREHIDYYEIAIGSGVVVDTLRRCVSCGDVLEAHLWRYARVLSLASACTLPFERALAHCNPELDQRLRRLSTLTAAKLLMPNGWTVRDTLLFLEAHGTDTTPFLDCAQDLRKLDTVAAEIFVEDLDKCAREVAARVQPLASDRVANAWKPPTDRR